MTTAHRCACILMLVFALAAGCGDDGGNETSTDTTDPIPTVAEPTSALPSATTVAGPVIEGVTDGAPCSPQGQRGVTQDGLAMLCALVGGDTRWRPA
jgi:hypothetical protein